MKVRCAYCKAEFPVEERKGLCCPQCGRVVILPRAARAKGRCVSRHERAQERLKTATDWTTGLILSQRPIFALGLAIAAIVGMVSLMGNSGGCTPAPPMTAVSFQRNIAIRELGVLQTALARFAQDIKRYPDGAEGLPALVNNPGLFAWKGPYVNLLRNDPWAHPYAYRSDSNRVGGTVFSAGPDGVNDTEDDVHPPPLNRDELNAYLQGRGDQAKEGTVSP